MEKSVREINSELFHKLIAYSEHNEYNDDFLRCLIEFWQFLPENEIDGNIFFAQYAMAHRNFSVALEYAEKAYSKRKINLTLWCVLRDCYYAVGDIVKAALFASKADKIYNEPVKLELQKDNLHKVLAAMTLGRGMGIYAPLANYRMSFTEQGIKESWSIFAGEFLPELVLDSKYKFFSAAYVEQELQDDKWKLMDALKGHPELAISRGDFTYDLIKLADEGTIYKCLVKNEPIALGIVGVSEHQKVEFQSSTGHSQCYLGKWENSFFRIDKDTTISSKEHLLCTAPIFLKHSPNRCKVVLNILLDGLCWRAIQDRNYDLVPNIIKFFSEGVIFNNHYSVSEYTYPSVATIETGLYPYHSQIFNDHVYHTLSSKYLSISEQMHKLGYYCVNIMGDSAGSYNGIMRGYDRMIVNCSGNTPLHVGVERTINHLEAFAETDQFIFLHASNPHLWSSHNFNLPLATQIQLSLEQRSLHEEVQRTSVHLPQRDIYFHWNKQGIKNCDANIKRLFDYLLSNYEDDEFLLTLYSDHGSPIYDSSGYLLSEYQNSAAFMMRGFNIPKAGLVDDLTSAVDIYPTLGKCLGFKSNLVDGSVPSLFGGNTREYVVSMSMFPPHPYSICIRTKEYECQASSRSCLDEDGRADLSDMKMDIYRLDNRKKVDDIAIRKYFQRILKQETKEIDNNGTQWPNMRVARPEWFPEGDIK